METKLHNVQEDIRYDVAQDQITTELAIALEEMFTITYYKSTRSKRNSYSIVYCKPSRTIAASLLLDREIVGIVANYDDIEFRTISYVKKIITSEAGRLEPTTALIVHADPRGDEKLRNWGRESGLKIIPVYRAKRGTVPPSEVLKRNLAHELFAADPFQVTGPVVKDVDFFGRGNEAIELLRQLQNGRIRSVFGIRKIGKTSLLNRVIKLAKESGYPSIAMVDCSVKEFNQLSTEQALRALAKVAKVAAHRGYAHISDAIKRSDQELVPVFDDLWNQENSRSLAIIFDEIDYITPASPTAPQWQYQFNDFWREFRVVVQEAQRHDMTVGILISGVSSRSFRLEQINDVENSSLHFVPEEYLEPFARTASKAMLRDLGKRCGLLFSSDSREMIAEVCGDFPFWMRMAGSHIHHAIDIDTRPIEVSGKMLMPLLEEFVSGEGAEIARVALEDMQHRFHELVDVLEMCVEREELPYADGRLLVRYGLARKEHMKVRVTSDMISAGLRLLNAVAKSPSIDLQALQTQNLKLDLGEWAEELAIINRRRILLEHKLREFIRYSLKVTARSGETWVEQVYKSLQPVRRQVLASFSSDILMEKLYWQELGIIITKYWQVFEPTFGDMKAFKTTMDILNDRPDAHAKPADLADIALQRRHLSWLEDKMA